MNTKSLLLGRIPGLLRCGSPVIGVHNDLRGVVVAIDGRGPMCADTLSLRVSRAGVDQIAFDLTDPTGRAHAAWWLAGQNYYAVRAGMRSAGVDDLNAIRDWLMVYVLGRDLLDVQIDALRRVVLAVAGLEVSDAR